MSVSPQQRDEPFAASQLAAALPPLVIEAERVAHVIYQGTHGRRRAGMGENFWQFRRYEMGDPINHIDWRQSARIDKVFVREREWEAAQTAYLWADNSGSMDYASRKKYPTKAERAQLLMLALSSLLLRGGETVQWLDHRIIRAHGQNGLRSIVERLGQGSRDNLPPVMRMARHSVVVLASDFLMPQDDFSALMRHFAAHKQRGILLHILDPAEDNFTFTGRVEMHGNEGEASLLVPNAEQIAVAYQQRMAEHKARLADAARHLGWFYIQHLTNEMPQSALLQLYNLLAADKGN